MHKINFSQRAVDDLDNIWNYTAENWSVEQADNYYKIIISCCNTIAENPLLCGKKYDDVKDGLLGCKVKKLKKAPSWELRCFSSFEKIEMYNQNHI